MSFKNSIGNFTAFILILFINLLLVLKYSYAYLSYPFLITLLYLILVIGHQAMIVRQQKCHLSYKGVFYFYIAVTILSLFYVLFLPRYGQINRLPAIEDWWRLFENGLFPYNSRLAPSSFPGLFFMLYPLYKLNLLDLLPVIGIAIFLFLLYRFYTHEKPNVFSSSLFLSSPFFFYSLAVRSELFFNTVLLILIFYLLGKKQNGTAFYSLSFLAGWTLATRSILIVPFIVFSLFIFREDLKKLLVFWGISAMTFLFFLLPFYFWDERNFWLHGPFAIQFKLFPLPFWVSLSLIVISFYIGWAVSSWREAFLSIGVLLLFISLVSYLPTIFKVGFYTALIHDKMEFSYLIFSFPFLLLAFEFAEKRT